MEDDEAFYKRIAQTSRRSARTVVPLVKRLLSPKSVIDVGCGTGTWLSAFAESGIRDYVGVEGNHFPTGMLEIPAENYVSFDLTRPYACDRTFDLVVSLEVAERLPSQCAVPFVQSLVALGSAVLFCAATPRQRGTHHISEQWQDYWAALFRRHDCQAIDSIRNEVWRSDRPRKAKELAIWREGLTQAAQHLRGVLPQGSAFLLIGVATVGGAFDSCGRAIPFPQKNGIYEGPPANSRSAIGGKRRLQFEASGPLGRPAST